MILSLGKVKHFQMLLKLQIEGRNTCHFHIDYITNNVHSNNKQRLYRLLKLLPVHVIPVLLLLTQLQHF